MRLLQCGLDQNTSVGAVVFEAVTSVNLEIARGVAVVGTGVGVALALLGLYTVVHRLAVRQTVEQALMGGEGDWGEDGTVRGR